MKHSSSPSPFVPRTQADAVYLAMQDNGGYATLGHLNQTVLKVAGVAWNTKTPFATIRRIVQKDDRFFKIRRGLWGLAKREAEIRALLTDNTTVSVAPVPAQKLRDEGHTFYQGLLAELGVLRGYGAYIPAQDKNRSFRGGILADAATETTFRSFTYDHLVQRGRSVDVCWFNERGFPHAFFEVEHSTPMQNSLGKFVEFQDFRIEFRIVADVVRQEEFQKVMSQTQFTALKGRVKFTTYDTLLELHEKEMDAHIARQSSDL